MFLPAQPSNVVKDIIAQIEAVIFDGKIPPGERLPAERELQKLFQTSRSTVREALKALAYRGLLEIRTGSRGGAFVKRAGGEQIAMGITQLIRFGEVTFSQITEFRQGVETLAVRLAAQNATEAETDRLTRLLAELKRALSKGPGNWRAFFIIESRMHQAILPMTGNPLYETVLKIIHYNLWKYYEMLPRVQEAMDRAFRDWTDLTAAIRHGDGFTATRVMIGHLLEYHRYLEEYFCKKNVDEHDMAKFLFEEAGSPPPSTPDMDAGLQAVPDAL